MYRELVHIYGPFSINTFGLFIALGLIVFTILVLHDKRARSLVTTEQFLNVFSVGFIAVIAGGRMLYVLTAWNTLETVWDAFAIWTGGFSVLGSLLGILAVIPWYLRIKNIPILPFLDLVATYIPLAQSIARWGCFFAGCCYGMPTSSALGIVCPEPIDERLHGLPLHPTQLYSSALLFIIFLILYFIIKPRATKPGQLACAYLILMSIERFAVDFWRADREFIGISSTLSVAQLIAIAIAFGALCGLILISAKFFKKK
jgi:phosphatidylglycerol:prolipoprotein diacylglycerol transferase